MQIGQAVTHVMFIFLSYVDKYRSFATKIGGGTEDLKEAILTSGFVN